MAPDCILSLRAAARLFAYTGVHDLEVVDVAIRLIEVAIAIPVIAVPHVELAQVVVDFAAAHSACSCGVIPGVRAILHKIPDRGADNIAAEVRTIASFIERNLDPIGDVPVDRIAIGGLLDVIVAHRDGVRRSGKEQIFEVGAAKIWCPNRRVVYAAVGLRDLIMNRSRVPAGNRMHFIAKFSQNGPDRIFPHTLQLHVSSMTYFMRCPTRFAIHLGLEGSQLIGSLHLAERMSGIVSV